MDQFLKTNQKFFESDKKKSGKSWERDFQKKRILRVKKSFLPFWMRRFPENLEGIEGKATHRAS
ncbi:MAG: hypothetical protein AMJ90_00030 [candidate division Zixibacteria bacterium SM23_73_2]|nr:MAG: hypothetical protein AMJ90_00030 [candidate division Zixibacteria bacterium SM23_73_2]